MSQILRYELYRHESLIERIRGIAPSAAQCRLAPHPHQATWQVVFYICRCYYTGHLPTVSDVYLSAGISKVTAIKRLRELEELGVVTIETATADRRRKLVAASPGLKQVLEQFVDGYVSELRQVVGDSGVSGPDTEPERPPCWAPHHRRAAAPVAETPVLGDLGHEVRNLLNSILGFADAIRSEVLGPVAPAGYREYANDIYGAGQHLETMISELIEMSQAAIAGDRPVAYEDVDAGEVISDVIAASRDAARKAGVEIGAEVPRNLPPVRADRRRLRQVLLSLVGHAIRHHGAGSHIAVATEATPEAIRFHIRNTTSTAAPGASAAKRPRPPRPPVADKLARGGRPRGAEAMQSAGVAISRSLVEVLGAALRFERSADGFADATLELPLSPSRRAARRSAGPRPYPSERGY